MAVFILNKKRVFNGQQQIEIMRNRKVNRDQWIKDLKQRIIEARIQYSKLDQGGDAYWDGYNRWQWTKTIAMLQEIVDELEEGGQEYPLRKPMQNDA